MQTTQLLMLFGALMVGLVLLVVFILWVKKPTKKSTPGDIKQKVDSAADEQIDKIFDDNFREELKNRGRLHFEKIINENSMFLQQDLRLTTSQINDFLKQEISKTLRQEFARYEQSIDDAKQVAVDSIEKTRQAIEQQRELLGKQLEHELAEEKARYVARLEKNMAEILNHYVITAIGDQISLDDQLEYILSELENNKKEIIEDVQNGA